MYLVPVKREKKVKYLHKQNTEEISVHLSSNRQSKIATEIIRRCYHNELATNTLVRHGMLDNYDVSYRIHTFVDTYATKPV